MSAAPFTPGPWSPLSFKSGRGKACGVYSETNYPLARLFSTQGEPGSAEANARLIASAPDLYEAVCNLLGLFDNAVYRRRLAGDGLYVEVIEQARAALAKATGNTPSQSSIPPTRAGEES